MDDTGSPWNILTVAVEKQQQTEIVLIMYKNPTWFTTLQLSLLRWLIIGA